MLQGHTKMLVKQVFFGLWNYKLDALGQRVQSYDKAVQAERGCSAYDPHIHSTVPNAEKSLSISVQEVRYDISRMVV